MPHVSRGGGGVGVSSDKCISFSGLSLSRRSNSEKLTRFKIAARSLMTFAGEFFYRRNRKTESLQCFVSTGRDTDKPEEINGCYEDRRRNPIGLITVFDQGGMKGLPMMLCFQLYYHYSFVT